MNTNEEDKSIEIVYNPSTFPLMCHPFQNIIITLLLLSFRMNCLISSLPRDILFFLFQIIFDSEFTFPGTTLLSLELQKHLLKWLPNKKWDLLYKGVRDGLFDKTFHFKCDKRGENLSIIKANGFLFGGWTPLSWCVGSGWKGDETKKSFIFTLTNPHSIPPTQYFQLNDDRRTIYSSCKNGPCFGRDDIDIQIDKSHGSYKNYFDFPDSFIDTTGKGSLTFNGLKEGWIVQDIEVYGV